MERTEILFWKVNGQISNDGAFLSTFIANPSQWCDRYYLLCHYYVHAFLERSNIAAASDRGERNYGRC